MFPLLAIGLLSVPGSVDADFSTGLQRDGLLAIENKGASMTQVRRSIHALGPVTEPPEFWADIANNPEFSDEHRSLCMLQLFKRHVSRGMTLEQLNRMLKGATWLTQQDVHLWLVICGYVPVDNFTVARHHTARLFTIGPRGGVGPCVWLVLDIDQKQYSVGERQFFVSLQGKEIDPKYKDVKIIDICVDSLPEPVRGR
jgi:hypothetical protein